MKRKGIATRLIERVCEDALKDGYDITFGGSTISEDTS